MTRARVIDAYVATRVDRQSNAHIGSFYKSDVRRVYRNNSWPYGIRMCVGLMARRAFKTATHILLNATFCLAFWLGRTMAQEAAAHQPDEPARSIAPQGRSDVRAPVASTRLAAGQLCAGGACVRDSLGDRVQHRLPGSLRLRWIRQPSTERR